MPVHFSRSDTKKVGSLAPLLPYRMQLQHKQTQSFQLPFWGKTELLVDDGLILLWSDVVVLAPLTAQSFFFFYFKKTK